MPFLALAAGGHAHLLVYNRLMPWDHAPGWLLHAEAGGSDAAALTCTTDVGRAAYEVGVLAGVGGAGMAAASGDLLLGALASCAHADA